MSKVKKNAPAEPKRTSKKSYKKYTPVLQKMQEGSQCYLILQYILENGNITPKEAERRPIYSMRLASRICDLRQKWEIPIETETVYTKQGRHYASYYIGG